MSSKKSRKSKLEDSDSDSGPDDRNPPKKAKNEKATSASTSGDDELKFPLSKYKFVTVREFRGKLLVDIREHYEKDGEMMPGRKGICLNMEQWNALKEQMENIEGAIKKF
ncbi:activated RNA polymerase II transcriptional coactivator p15 [Trichonephila clavata]|uniref:Activated RNA polymerase II transcriptional coactivator p15 n=1 Tax=Trichonephila clavata TaxID=2740835 RepID=A0A8X6I2A3_TRICU|nr:activated RNA polymerase II transcriptional coactivator p15 [Trichonephila clavata]